jgi:long-subunit fatty acid transport protein
MRRVFIIAIMTTVANKMFAQQRPETGVWFAVNLPVNFSKHWQWHNDGGYRTLGTSVEPLQYFYRTGIRYNFNKQWSTSGGIAFFFTKTNFSKSEHEFGHEFRFWEEVVHQHLLNEKLQGLLRFRTEQRFFAATSTKTKYTGYRFRFRPGLNQKLNNKWSLQLTDEYMRQAANHKFSFDQNRLTFSGIYQFNKTTQLQAGYMWLKWPKDNQHILTFTFTKNLSLHGD